LHLVAPRLLQVRQHALVFHALGHRLQAEAKRHLDHGLDDGRIVRIDGEVAHEGLVDLEAVHGKALEAGEA
jgi:hypothetical protein